MIMLVSVSLRNVIKRQFAFFVMLHMPNQVVVAYVGVVKA